jgi:hypothetical protein
MKVYVISAKGTKILKSNCFDMETDETAMEKALRSADYLVDDIRQGKSEVTNVVLLQQAVDGGQTWLLRYYGVKKDEWTFPKRSVYDGMPAGEEATFYM